MNPTPTPEQKQLLHQARRTKLMQIWASGSRRLSADELAEISDLTGAKTEAPPAPATTFNLGDGAAPLPAKLRDFYKKPLAGYEEIYGRGERAIKRWVSTGRHATPPEPPPLDDPTRMAGWWRKHMDMNPPRELLAYERGAPTTPPASSELPPADRPGSPERHLPPFVPGSAASMVGTEVFVFEEGQALQRARRIEATNGVQVETAQAQNNADEYRRWFPIWVESSTLLKQLEKEYREAAKASGSMLPKAKVAAELAQMLDALRLMREAMPQKIIAELEKRAEGRLRRVLSLITPVLIEAIQTVRQREGEVLANVESLSSPGAAREAFALQAA